MRVPLAPPPCPNCKHGLRWRDMDTEFNSFTAMPGSFMNSVALFLFIYTARLLSRSDSVE